MASRNEPRTLGTSGQVTPMFPEQQAIKATPADVARFGRTVCVKGEIVGSEDLTIDGRVEGRIDLPDHTLTVLPNAAIDADIAAKAVVVFGSVAGSVTAREKLEIRKSGSVTGHVVCPRLSIQEGAYLEGKVEMPRREDTSDAAQTDEGARFAPAV